MDKENAGTQPEGTEKLDPKKANELSDLKELHVKLAAEFQEKYWKSAAENKRFRKGEHWSAEEESEISDQDLVAYSLALAGSKININISQQMANRQEYRCLGRGKEDEINAEVKTNLLKYITDNNDFDNTESDIYADGIGKKYGVVKRYTDYSNDVKGRIVLKRMPYNQVMWDLNCTDYNIPRYAKFMQEFDYYTREELKEIYPDKKEMIDKIEDAMWEGKDSSPNVIDWYRLDRGQKLLKIVTHYQRRYKTTYSRVMSDKSVVKSDISLKDEDNTGQNENNYKIIPQSTISGYVEQKKTVLKEIPRIEEYIEAIVFTETLPEELDRYLLQIEDPQGNAINSQLHCNHPYFSFFDDGDVICLMDYLKQPQKFLDRLTMQIDKSMSKMIKTSYTYMKDLLSQYSIDNWDILSGELVSGGALVEVKDHNAIRAIESGIITPELFTMWQFMYKVLEDLSGGRNNAGLKESANESGVAIEQRKAAAFSLSYLYIDNLQRWKKTLGEGLMENIDEVYGWDKTGTFRILGDALSQEVIELLKEQSLYEGSGMPYGYGYINLEKLQKPLGETKVDIIISRANSTPTQKEQRLNQLMGFYKMKAANGEKTPPLSLMFPFMDIDPTVKASIIKWENQQNEKEASMMDLQRKQLEFKGNMEIAKATVDANKSIKMPEVSEQDQVNPYLRRRPENINQE